MITTIIAARDASATIARAVRSALDEPDCRILLVDDQCVDDTVAQAKRCGGNRLDIVRSAKPGGVPLARQAGLDAVETEFAAWLDADDVWVAGRATRIVRALEAGADVFCDPIQLIDGATGTSLRRLDVPEFVRREVTPARLFERNHLPGDTQVGFRVSAFREAGGYDAGVFGAESFDILLRVIMRGGRFSYGDEIGYRMHAYKGSVSRNLARQRDALALALRKHDFEDVRRLCLGVGESVRVAAWVLVSMALFRGEPQEALRFLEEASPAGGDPDFVIEEDGPWPFREGWRRAFQRGTCLLLIGGRDAEAEDELRRAEEMEPTAEGANNLGVALARTKRLEKARELWRAAERRFPGYLDARLNLADPCAQRITTHPLRRQASRSEY